MFVEPVDDGSSEYRYGGRGRGCKNSNDTDKKKRFVEGVLNFFFFTNNAEVCRIEPTVHFF